MNNNIEIDEAALMELVLYARQPFVSHAASAALQVLTYRPLPNQRPSARRYDKRAH